MKKTIYTFFLTAVTSICLAQTPYTDNTAGFTLMIPEGWTHEAFESGETALACSSEDQTASYNIALKKLDEGATAADHLKFLESYMPASGYSENFMPEESRYIAGDAAAAYGADDICGGAYTKTAKNGIVMAQIIFVYRKDRYAYITISTCTQEQLTAWQPVYDVFYNSFKITE